MPEDKTLGVHEVEMNDGEAIILVDPYRQDRFRAGALGSDRRGGELNLLVVHTLDHDLTGGPAPQRWDDDESIGADGNMAVAGRLYARSGLSLVLQNLEGLLPELMELCLQEAKRVRIGQLQQALFLIGLDHQCFGQVRQVGPVGGKRGGQAVRLVAGGRGEWIGVDVVEPGLSTKSFISSSS